MKSLSKNSFYNLIKSASKVIFPLLTFSYASRVLLPEGLGKIEFANSYVSYFSLFAMLGITSYATREASKLRYDSQKLSRFAFEILSINAVSVVISYIIFYVSIATVEHLQMYDVLLYITSLSIILTALGVEWLYAAMEDYRYITIRTILFQIFTFIATILLVKDQDDIVTYAIINVLSVGGSYMINFVHARKYLSFVHIGQCHPGKHIKPILTLFGMTVCVQIFTHLDTTMLGFMISDTSVGIYTAASKMVNVVTSMLVAITAVLAPRIALYASEEKNDEIKRLSYRAINGVLLLVIPATIGLILLAPEFIVLFSGANFIDGAYTARILAFRVMLSPINTFIIVHLFISIGKERCNVFTTACAAGMNIIVNFLLIPDYAEIGAAVATVMAEVMELFINLYFVRSVLSIKEMFRFGYQYILGGILIIGEWMLLQKLAFSEFWCIPFSAIAALSYFLFLYVIKNPEIVCLVDTKILKSLKNK